MKLHCLRYTRSEIKMEFTIILIIICTILIIVIPMIVYWQQTMKEQRENLLSDGYIQNFIREILPNPEVEGVANVFGILASNGIYNKQALVDYRDNLSLTDWHTLEIVLPKAVYTGFLNLTMYGYKLTEFDINFINGISVSRIANPFVRGNSPQMAEINGFLTEKLSYVLIHFYLKTLYPELNDNYEGSREAMMEYFQIFDVRILPSYFDSQPGENSLYSDGTYIHRTLVASNSTQRMATYMNGLAVIYYTINQFPQNNEWRDSLSHIRDQIAITFEYFTNYMGNTMSPIGSSTDFTRYPFVCLRTMLIAMYNTSYMFDYTNSPIAGVNKQFLLNSIKLIQSINIVDISSNTLQLYPLHGITNFYIDVNSTPRVFTSSWAGTYNLGNRIASFESPLLWAEYQINDPPFGMSYINTTRYYFLDDYDMNIVYAFQIMPNLYHRDPHMLCNYISSANASRLLTSQVNSNATYFIGFNATPVYIKISDTEDLFVNLLTFDKTLRIHIIYIANNAVYQYYEFNNTDEVEETCFYSKYSCSNLNSSITQSATLNDKTAIITRDGVNYYYQSDQNVIINRMKLEDFQGNTIDEVLLRHNTANATGIMEQMSIQTYFSTVPPPSNAMDRIKIITQRMIELITEDGNNFLLNFTPNAASFTYSFTPSTANPRLTVDTLARLYVNPYTNTRFTMVDGKTPIQDPITKSFYVDME